MSTVATAISTGGALFDKLGINFSSITLGGLFGSKCSDKQKKAKTKLANLIEENTTYSERQAFIDRQNMNNPVSPDGQSMAHFFYGQGDCKHKNVGTGDQRYLDNLEGWLTKKVEQAQAGPPEYEDKYNGNPGYTSEPSGETKSPQMASIGGGMLNGLAVPLLLLAGIAFAFNQYQNG